MAPPPDHVPFAMAMQMSRFPPVPFTGPALARLLPGGWRTA